MASANQILHQTGNIIIDTPKKQEFTFPSILLWYNLTKQLSVKMFSVIESFKIQILILTSNMTQMQTQRKYLKTDIPSYKETH